MKVYFSTSVRMVDIARAVIGLGNHSCKYDSHVISQPITRRWTEV